MEICLTCINTRWRINLHDDNLGTQGSVPAIWSYILGYKYTDIEFKWSSLMIGWKKHYQDYVFAIKLLDYTIVLSHILLENNFIKISFIKDNEIIFQSHTTFQEGFMKRGRKRIFLMQISLYSFLQNPMSFFHTGNHIPCFACLRNTSPNLNIFDHQTICKCTPFVLSAVVAIKPLWW